MREVKEMDFIGNVIWLCVAGFWQALGWFIAGIVCSVTIVGIPFGRQCFKHASLWLHPFDQDVVYGGGAPSTLMNLLWLLLCGWVLALCEWINGLLLCLTIIGIPFGLQCFKLAKLSLLPFGAQVIPT